MTPTQFSATYYPAAQAVAASTGVPSLLILAQAALESGWGKSAVGNNFFGIKADTAWLANGGAYHLSNTHETINGVSILFTEKNDPTGKYRKFRSYNSAQESFADWAKFISGNPKRYGKVLSAPDSIEAAKALQEAGYATAATYADSLIVTMHSISPASIPTAVYLESYARAFPKK